jgi:hypothetical protein
MDYSTYYLYVYEKVENTHFTIQIFKEYIAHLCYSDWFILAYKLLHSKFEEILSFSLHLFKTFALMKNMYHTYA